MAPPIAQPLAPPIAQPLAIQVAESKEADEKEENEKVTSAAKIVAPTAAAQLPKRVLVSSKKGLAAAASAAPSAAAASAAVPAAFVSQKRLDASARARAAPLEETTNEFMARMHSDFEANQKESTAAALAMPAMSRAVREQSRLAKEQQDAARGVSSSLARVPEGKEDEDVFGADMEQLAEQAGSESTSRLQKGGDDRNIILTSDQKVLLISLRKEKVISSLQKIMKTVAVDCELNFDDNNDGSYRCLALDESIAQAAYHPNLDKDIKETRDRYKRQEIVSQAVKAPLAVSSALAEAPLAEAPLAEAPLAEAPLAQAPLAEAPLVEQEKKPLYKILKINKIPHLIIEKKDETGTTTALIAYKKEDTELTEPLGYIKIDPKTRLPSGKLLPIPEGFFP